MPDYSIVTELPQTWVTAEQLQRCYQRYAFASAFVGGKQVLEIGSGGGQGIGLLREAGARSVTALDVDPSNVLTSQRTYGRDGGVAIVRGDAGHLPFREGSFGCILMFEVIYYLRDAAAALRQCRSLLTRGGTLVVQSVNCEWSDFHPSPYAVRYFAAGELAALLQETGFSAEMYSGFPVGADLSVKTRCLSLLHRTANRLHLIPRSMKYKRYVRQLFFGGMVRMPARLQQGLCPYSEPAPLDVAAYDPQFKVLFGVGRRP
ncbi:MAG: class I SAM-dependent methyltransferase [Deltaproteobacteria bacterium]|nr:class I SAM-dependent methyltransferase [Deltaproteobacteria bacterium]